MLETTEATIYLLRSDKARSYGVNGQQYMLDLERDEHGGLTVTTWGFDYDGITIPKTRSELIRLKVQLQFRKMNGPLDAIGQVALRYYFDILRRSDRVTHDQ